MTTNLIDANGRNGEVKDDTLFQGSTVSTLLQEIHPNVAMSQSTAGAVAFFLNAKLMPLDESLVGGAQSDGAATTQQLIVTAVGSVLVQEPYRTVFLQGDQCQVRKSLLKNKDLLKTDPDRFMNMFPHMLSVCEAKDCLAPFFTNEEHKRSLSALLTAFDLLTWLSVVLEDAVQLAKSGQDPCAQRQCVLQLLHVKHSYIRSEDLLILLAGEGFRSTSNSDALVHSKAQANDSRLSRRQRPVQGGVSWQEACPVDCLRYLFESGAGADITIIADDGVVACHRFMLVRRSQYFKARLDGGFYQESPAELITAGFNVELMNHVLRYIYTDSCDLKTQLPEDMAFCVHLLDAAVYFGMPGLELFLHDTVFSHDQLLVQLVDYNNGTFHVDNLCRIWQEASRMEALMWLTQRIEYLLGMSLNEISQSPAFANIPVDLIHLLLSGPAHSTSLADDTQLVEGLVNYAAAHSDATSESAAALLHRLLDLSWLESECLIKCSKGLHSVRARHMVNDYLIARKHIDGQEGATSDHESLLSETHTQASAEGFDASSDELLEERGDKRLASRVATELALPSISTRGRRRDKGQSCRAESRSPSWACAQRP